jgi:hypothetical protein
VGKQRSRGEASKNQRALGASDLVRSLLVARTKPTRTKAEARARVPRAPAGMTRRCSHCSNNGHNTRTCPSRGGGLRLFGVRLTSAPAAMKRSASMSCIASSLGAGSGGSSPTVGGAGGGRGGGEGYVSDDPAHASCSANGRAERKKGEIFQRASIPFVCLRCSVGDFPTSDAFVMGELPLRERACVRFLLSRSWCSTYVPC